MSPIQYILIIEQEIKKCDSQSEREKELIMREKIDKTKECQLYYSNKR